MRTTLKAVIAVVFIVLFSIPALADKGGNGNGNNGNGNGNGGPSTDGANGNGGGTGNGNANGHDKGEEVTVPIVTPDQVVVVPDDQKVARDAVRSKAALSLEAITAIVEKATDGRILDVQLVTFKGTYLYDVTVLERDGVLHKLYYYARSGIAVRTN
jgi:hypothetical protein